MDETRLRKLIIGGEDYNLEFKGESREKLPDRDLVETVVCMANRIGAENGILLIGVEDDGRISGAKTRHASGIDCDLIRALIANKTRPSLVCKVDLMQLDGKDIMIIEVPSGHIPVGTTGGKYLRRAMGTRGPECVPFHFHEMMAFQADRGLVDLTRTVVPIASWEDLDHLEFERFKRSIRETGRGDETLLNLTDLELARAVGAVETDGDEHKVRIAGLLLFGKEEAIETYIPTHEVAFQVLSGLDVEVNDFFHWPLIRVIEEILMRYRTRKKEVEIMVDLRRIGIPDYSEKAFREAVANALIHRDYTRIGGIHVQWLQDQIEISNPGGFPEGVRLDNFLTTSPRPRNPLLAEAFKRAGIVDKTARGIRTIFFEQLRNGRMVPSYERSSMTDVTLVIPGGKANLDFVKMVVEEGFAGHPLDVLSLLILNRLWFERLVASEDVKRMTQLGEGEVRSLLARLIESGYLEPRGEGKGRTYHLTAQMYSRMDESPSYVHIRGFEPIQQRQMVIQYVSSHGEISRKEVMALCRLSETQAYRLLKKLADELILEVKGKGRGAKYIAGSRFSD